MAAGCRRYGVYASLVLLCAGFCIYASLMAADCRRYGFYISASPMLFLLWVKLTYTLPSLSLIDG